MTERENDLEPQLLAAVANHPSDTDARLVYADWLQSQGRAGAEFLRAQVALRAAVLAGAGVLVIEELRSTVEAAAVNLPHDWLAALDRTGIEECGLGLVFECPREWELLTPTDNPRIRTCGVCSHQVHHCATIAEARKHVVQGRCVAVLSSVFREPDDLDWPATHHTMGLFLPMHSDRE